MENSSQQKLKLHTAYKCSYLAELLDFGCAKFLFFTISLRTKYIKKTKLGLLR